MDFLKLSGYHPKCNIDDDERYVRDGLDAGEIMRECFQMMDVSDQQICVLDTEVVSQGLTLEIGYALSKKLPITLLIKDDCVDKYDTIIRLADKVVVLTESDFLVPTSDWMLPL